MQSKFEPFGRQRFPIKHPASDGGNRRGIFRQPRQDHCTPCQRANLARFGGAVTPPADYQLKKTQRPASSEMVRKPCSTGNMSPRMPSLTQILLGARLYTRACRTAQSQHCKFSKHKAKAVESHDYIDLSDITINGEIPTKGILVEKIMSSELKTKVGKSKTRNLSTVSEYPFGTAHSTAKSPPTRCGSTLPRVRKTTRGIQPRRIVTASAHTQHVYHMMDSSSQYDTMLKECDSTQTDKEPEQKLTREEILDLLRNTYTTADIGVSVYTRKRKSPTAADKPIASSQKLPSANSEKTEKNHFKLSKGPPAGTHCNLHVRNGHTRRLHGSKICPSKDKDVISCAQSDSEGTLILCDDARHHDLKPMENEAIASGAIMSKQPGRSVSRIPRKICKKRNKSQLKSKM